jgi:biopolymer transport protein TolQ
MDQTIPATPTTPLEAGALTGSMPLPQGQDLSVVSLFLQADTIVKIVMIMLLLASFWTWAIIFDKALRLRRLRNQAKQFEEAFWSGGSLEGLVQTEQMRMSLQERIERVMDITLGREMDHLERHMIFLASVGSAAPFVGLFGTVWGIMNSFASIAASKNTTLAVVAPGIAEALFATALGLVAAIPAVLAYNKLSGDIGRFGNRLEAFAGEFGAILSRQLEEKR